MPLSRSKRKSIGCVAFLTNGYIASTGKPLADSWKRTGILPPD